MLSDRAAMPLHPPCLEELGSSCRARSRTCERFGRNSGVRAQSRSSVSNKTSAGVHGPVVVTQPKPEQSGASTTPVRRKTRCRCHRRQSTVLGADPASARRWEAVRSHSGPRVRVPEIALRRSVIARRGPYAGDESSGWTCSCTFFAHGSSGAVARVAFPPGPCTRSGGAAGGLRGDALRSASRCEHRDRASHAGHGRARARSHRSPASPELGPGPEDREHDEKRWSVLAAPDRRYRPLVTRPGACSTGRRPRAGPRGGHRSARNGRAPFRRRRHDDLQSTTGGDRSTPRSRPSARTLRAGHMPAGRRLLQLHVRDLRWPGRALPATGLRLRLLPGQRAVRTQHVQRRPGLLQLQLRHLRGTRRRVQPGAVQHGAHIPIQPGLRDEYLQFRPGVLRCEVRALRASRGVSRAPLLTF
jgi:hypothetical protein